MQKKPMKMIFFIFIMCLIFVYDIYSISNHLTRKASEDRGNAEKIGLFVDICLRAYSIIVVISLFCDIKDAASANETRSMQAKDMQPNSSNNNNHQHGQHSDRYVIYREAAKSHANTKF